MGNDVITIAILLIAGLILLINFLTLIWKAKGDPNKYTTLNKPLKGRHNRYF